MNSSVGAVADLFEIACLYDTTEFAEIQVDTFDIWEKYNGLDPHEWDLVYEFLDVFDIPLVGFHYFINYDGTLLPKFDFTSAGPTEGNPDAFVVGTKVVDVPAPDSARDVDWLELKAMSGKFADDVFRVETIGGQPPTSVSSVCLYSDLLVQSRDLLRSAPQDQIRSPLSMLHNTVSAHNLTILAWPLMTLRI